MVNPADLDFSLPGEREFQDLMTEVFRKALVSRGLEEAAAACNYGDVVSVVVHEGTYVDNGDWLQIWGDQVCGNRFLEHVANLVMAATWVTDLGSSEEEAFAELLPEMEILRREFGEWIPEATPAIGAFAKLLNNK